MPPVLAYFLTWTTYGTWLPGDERGWVNRANSSFGARFNRPSTGISAAAKRRMRFRPVRLSARQRRTLQSAIESVFEFRGWQLLIANCRSNHVHVVAQCGDIAPDRVTNQLKSYATRALRRNGLFEGRPVWTRGGSTRYINNAASLASAIEYVQRQ